MSPVPTEDDATSFLANSELDLSRQVSEADLQNSLALLMNMTNDPNGAALFESLVQQNLSQLVQQNLQLSTQSFAEIARINDQNQQQQQEQFSQQNFNPEAQAFVPRT
jgi:hypothetical protein